MLQPVPRRADVSRAPTMLWWCPGTGQKHLVLAERFVAHRLSYDGLLQLAQPVLLQGRDVKHGA